MKKTHVPKFKSDAEMARWFETHDTADYWDNLKQTLPVDPPARSRKPSRHKGTKPSSR